MTMELLRFIFEGYFHFFGCLILLIVLLQYGYNMLFRVYNRILRVINIRKHGWPPPHCDADGDFKP